MKLIIAGSRTITDRCLGFYLINYCILDYWKMPLTKVKEIVSGAAKGVDKIGEEFAKEFNIKCTRFPANWERYGKRAGYIRNDQMVRYANALLAIWDGKSKGTQSTIHLAKKRYGEDLVCVFNMLQLRGE